MPRLGRRKHLTELFRTKAKRQREAKAEQARQEKIQKFKRQTELYEARAKQAESVSRMRKAKATARKAHPLFGGILGKKKKQGGVVKPRGRVELF